jgi:leucyl aminopeptidase
MTDPIHPQFIEHDLNEIAGFKGRLVVFVGKAATLDRYGRRVNRLCKGALSKFVQSAAFEKLTKGHCQVLSSPVGMAADGIIVCKLERRPKVLTARRAGAEIAKVANDSNLLLLAGTNSRSAEITYGVCLRRYAFSVHKSSDAPAAISVTVMVMKHKDVAAEYADKAALAEGTFFTRDLVNEPANVLTTTEFADRLLKLRELGVDVKVLEEKDLEKLGMHSLLGVGLGSESPTKLVVMSWNGGGKEAPFALVGKGVVFDTGGISIKPSSGMELMTMDMGGAGVVAGVMKCLALRKAKANVVGLVGLVENMPDGKAQRPGDIVKSMKGDTIEVINTDAEGRLVLADVLWYAQKTYKPTGVINLATLTGAIIVALGHENAGVFSNDDDLCKKFMRAAKDEDEGAWRMPLGKAYDKLIDSNFADVKNTGGRDAGSITAAQFLQRFIEPDMPWIHLDIAGVAATKKDTEFAPKGASGWGVRALNRLIADNYEA